MRRWQPPLQISMESEAKGSSRGFRKEAIPILILTGLGLLFFSKLLVHPSSVLYSDHSDLLAFQLPLERFLVGSWHATGETPLWNPYSFAGIPLVHDIQATAFYPLHLPLRLLPEAKVGAALSWSIVVHVLVAGWSMYSYARSQNLTRTGATIAALGYMFAGKWMLHLLLAGHSMFIGIAWLPLVALGLERSIRRGSLVSATWAGAAFAMIVLATHPQLTFYAGLFLAVWTLGTALELAGFLGAEGSRSWRRTGLALGRWLVLGAWLALVAVGLAAVQLLPTFEAVRWTSRSAVGITPTLVVDLMLSFLGLVGPAVRGMPTSFAWEGRSGLGVLWITAALLAPFLVRSGRVRYQSCVCLAMIVFAITGGLILGGLPGFRLFRIPSRMYLIAALPIALLVGQTTQSLFGSPGSITVNFRRRRLTLLEVFSVALAWHISLSVAQYRMHAYSIDAYWVSLLITVPAAYWLLGAVPQDGDMTGRWSRNRLQIAWCSALLVDLWSLAWPLVDVRKEETMYSPSACVRYLVDQPRGHWRVLDRNVSDLDWVTPLPSALAMMLRLEPMGSYNPLDILRYKEFLRFIGGEDDLPEPSNGVGYFPIKNKPLLDLIGTRFLMEPSEPRSRQKKNAGVGDDSRWKKVFEDPAPQAYLFIKGGIKSLPPYSVYENSEAFPRAFVVPRAEPLPLRSQVLSAFVTNDFRRVAFLEGIDLGQDLGATGGFRPADIQEYLPNRVRVGVDGDSPGYLVLMDPWFPGWSCTLDGSPTRLYRANYAFRAVAMPAGSHEVVFTFAPKSYALGWIISGTSIAIVVLIGLVSVVVRSKDQPVRHENPVVEAQPN